MYQLAQINIAKMIGVNIDDPIMKEFVDNLDNINLLAEASQGFIWRLKDENENATNFNPYNNEKIIINISVWKDIKTLENFTYRSLHTEFVKRRKEWFNKLSEMHYALWWIKSNNFPTIEDCVQRLDYLQKNGASSFAFNFKHPFNPPL